MKRKLHYRIADRLGYDLTKKRKNIHATIERHVALLLKRHTVNCVLDVGAHEGEYARSLREAGYKGRILSFEPVAAHFATLGRLCAGDKAWRCYNFALGRCERTDTMTLYGAGQWASFLSASDFARECFSEAAEPLDQVKVPVRRLDSIWDELVDGVDDPRAYLKMDTQGYDLEVFAGAVGCLDRIRGLQSELSVIALYQNMPDYVEALTEYRSHGFEVTGFFPVFRDEESLILGEIDAVMFRRASAEQAPDPDAT